MTIGKEQAIRRSIVQLKTIQAIRRRSVENGTTTRGVVHKMAIRNLARGVCESIQFATGSTGKPVGSKTMSGHSAIATVTLIVGALLILAGASLSVIAALSQ